MITQKEIEIEFLENEITELKSLYYEASIEYDKYHGKNCNVSWTYGTATADRKEKISNKIEEKYRQISELDTMRFNKNLRKLVRVLN